MLLSTESLITPNIRLLKVLKRTINIVRKTVLEFKFRIQKVVDFLAIPPLEFHLAVKQRLGFFLQNPEFPLRRPICM